MLGEEVKAEASAEKRELLRDTCLLLGFLYLL